MTAADPISQPTPLEAALHYAALGLRVVPIIPGEKRPPFDEWQDKATTNTDTIRLWWGSNPAYGVGIATGHHADRWLFCVDVDTGADPKTGRIKEGDESLADLEATYGPLPDTVEGQSGSGGRHLWYLSPVPIHNDQAARLGVDLDIRGVGGQIVVAPTIHPHTRRPYTWLADQAPDEHPIVDAPDWLLELLTRPVDEQPRSDCPPYDGPERPGDRWARTMAWPDLLRGDGATFMGTRHDRKHGGTYELWARPGVDDHTSATLYYGGSDVLKVFTPNWPGLTQGETYTRFGFYAATEHGGDHAAAAARLARLEDDQWIHDTIGGLGDPPPADPPPPPADEPASRRNWHHADLAAIWADGLTRPEPTILHRDDGAALLYPGKTNTIFGESGAGKTWLLYIAGAQIIANGGHVIYLDWEDDAISYLSRMVALGVPAALVIANSTYYPVGTGPTIDDLEEIDRIITERGTELVGIDSTGEALAAQGLNQDKDNEVAQWMATLPRRWARLGPCVAMLDHMPHAGGREIGSQRKRAGISGAAYEAIATGPFSKDKAGSLTLKVAKDRGGNYPKGTEQAVVEFRPDADGTVMGWAVKAGSGQPVGTGGTTIDDICTRVLEHLTECGDKAQSTNSIQKAVVGDSGMIRVALKVLHAQGRLSRTEIGQGVYYRKTTEVDEVF